MTMRCLSSICQSLSHRTCPGARPRARRCGWCKAAPCAFAAIVHMSASGGAEMSELGQVVLYVRELKRSAAFYTEIVGLRQVGVLFGHRAAAFTGGRTHHDLLLIVVGAAPGPLLGRRIGLYHMGWRVGTGLVDLRAVRDRLRAHTRPIDGQAGHTVSRRLYVSDTDGNEIALYVDDPTVDWRRS